MHKAISTHTHTSKSGMYDLVFIPTKLHCLQSLSMSFVHLHAHLNTGLYGFQSNSEGITHFIQRQHQQQTNKQGFAKIPSTFILIHSSILMIKKFATSKIYGKSLILCYFVSLFCFYSPGELILEKKRKTLQKVHILVLVDQSLFCVIHIVCRWFLS